MEQPKYHLPGVIHTKTELTEDFEGPLDVIFLLLSKNKIEIQDVSITSILEQYLAFLDERKRMDMEVASEFIAMASHLMQIKTKMLLSVTEREEALTEMEQLRRSLEERQRAGAYEQIQIAAKFLEQRNEIGINLFTKQPEAYKVDHTYRYKHDKADLLQALAMISERNERQLPPPVSNFAGIVGAEPYPVTKKAQELLKRLVLRGVARFKSLFQGNCSRSEVVATFLAILELCRVKSVRLQNTDSLTDEVDVVFEKMPEESI